MGQDEMDKLGASAVKKDPPKMRLDINKVSMVGDVSLNDEVEITVKGRVVSIRGPEQYLTSPYDSCEGKGKIKEEERVYPGCLEVEIGTVTVGKMNEFEGMDGDE